MLYDGVPPCIGSTSILGGVYFSSSYVTMVVGFEFCLSVGAAVCRLKSSKSKILSYTKNTLSSPIPIFLNQMETVFLFDQIWKIQNSRIFYPSEDHQFWINLWNPGIWLHSWYSSDQDLINRLNHHCKFSIVYILCFIHSAHENFPSFLLNQKDLP